mmetsp:Transcript_68912/g.165405  ORF Transcript_68912/g.165405 Transcript_68912/m.165405 type:complete len:203 (+) Transcript_68912:76-684(+)|eukprot:CAMPEP_0178424722 /NCGR_PEP_ID=MMETSP0689_2-20121128/28358_1 /TAXON_ID=160604 /ORGANISM="Amphidinium massartii, Strain CS-259" /LENGTH=202 /DNA_ID=CAMNT_0020046371 /DNA_START=75 /DNA_END=683 /DNA_ORIENTATION=+
MWRADPGPCVAPVLAWGESPDDIEYERMLKAMPKKVLLCRELIMKDSQLEKVCKRLGKIDFSLVVWKLSEYSRSSGFGDAAASFVKVYYETKAEKKVLNVFSAAGCALEESEVIPVDPKSSCSYEQDIMYFPNSVYYKDGVMEGDQTDKKFSVLPEEGKPTVINITASLGPPGTSFLRSAVGWEEGPPLTPEEIRMRQPMIA